MGVGIGERSCLNSIYVATPGEIMYDEEQEATEYFSF